MQDIYRFDPEQINLLCTYNERQTYFELYFFQVGQLYVQIEKEGACVQHTLWSKADIVNMFSHIDKALSSKQKFIQVWMRSSTKRFYMNLVFVPYAAKWSLTNATRGHSSYNIFNGFKIYTQVDIGTSFDVLSDFMMIGVELCEGKLDTFKYFLDFLAHIIQYPATQVDIGIIIKGPQGTGKNMFLEAFSTILGDGLYFSSSNPADIFGEHATGAVQTLLVNFDEAEASGSADLLQRRLKTFITSKKFRVNPKGKTPFDVANYSRVVLTSNKERPIRIDFKSGDRRWVVYKATKRFLNNDTGIFKRLATSMCTQPFKSSLYSFLKTRNIQNWNPNSVDDRIRTKTYYDLALNSVDSAYLFIEELIERTKPEEETCKMRIGVFANEYNKFRIKVGEKYMSNHNKVKKHFYKLFGKEIKFSISRGYLIVSFNVSKLNKFVKAKLRV